MGGRSGGSDPVDCRKVGIIAEAGGRPAGIGKLINAITASGAVPLLTAPLEGLFKPVGAWDSGADVLESAEIVHDGRRGVVIASLAIPSKTMLQV